MVNNTFIEASTDNFVSSTVELVHVSEELHEGWNYYDLTEYTSDSSTAKYQYYRMRSNATEKGCDAIGEIHFFGHEVIADTNDAYSCNIELVEFSTDANGDTVETKTDLT